MNDTQSFPVPAAHPYGPAPLTVPAVTLNSASTTTYSNNTTKAQYVQDVKLECCSAPARPRMRGPYGKFSVAASLP